MKRPGKYVGIFVDTAIDNRRLGHRCQVLDLPRAVSQEENLQVKAPSPHILIKIGKVRVVVDTFMSDVPMEPVAKFVSQGRFSGAYVACNEH
jgi:hypothetical protein